MSDWHGYPQHPDSYPDRPWWRRRRVTATTVGWERWPDRVFAHIKAAYTEDDESELLDHIDREHPLPTPPPLCGQVWVWPWMQLMVVSVDYGVTPPMPIWSMVPQWYQYHGSEWPPAGAVLVAGPGAPWGSP